tara:strand:+ start:118304 stop:118516 length:213 start_codon:yes stop_codon:yes gene_type:complete
VISWFWESWSNGKTGVKHGKNATKVRRKFRAGKGVAVVGVGWSHYSDVATFEAHKKAGTAQTRFPLVYFK